MKRPGMNRRGPARGASRSSRGASRTVRGGPSAAGRRPLREDLVMQACLEAYGAVRHEGRLADRALELTLRHKRNLYSTERRAVAERVYALLRRQRLIDEVLQRARPSFESLATARKDLLRVAAARAMSGESLDDIVDGRAVPAEDRATLQRLPAAQAEVAKLPEGERFAIEASLPDFLAKRLLTELGPEAWQLAEAMNVRAPLNARVNTLKGTREELTRRLAEEEVGAKPTPLSPLGLTLDERLNAFSLKAFKDGWFEIQDEGSQLLGMLVDPMPTKVVDACAGAGGKTLQLAAEMKNRGELYALDVDERRLGELKLRARRAGVHNVRIKTIPAEEGGLDELVGKADRVLVDAPCSGTGTLRRKPDSRYRLLERDIAEYAAKQQRLLHRFSQLVKPGGWLVYGTCSVLTEENEAVVTDFLDRHRDFTLKPVSERLGAALGDRVSSRGMLRLYPHRHGTDGFFGAILVRQKATG